MRILAVDTSSEICSVAILENDRVIAENSLNDGKTHSENLMTIMENTLEENKTKLNDIDLIACSVGPGSFTGIRIGISTIKAFSDVTNIKSIGITSLMALAYNNDYSGYICSLIDAKNNNVYYSLFDTSTNKYVQIGDYLAQDINSITEILKVCNKPIFFVGNGSIVYKDVLESALKENAIFTTNNEENKLSAKSIGIAAFDVFSNNEYGYEEFNLSPIYLRKSSAERELEEKQNGNNN